MSELPELAMLIPRIMGVVYSYAGTTYLAPENIADASKAPEHGVVRCGFRLYELLEWSEIRSAWSVRPFTASLSDAEIQKLSSERRPDAEG